MWYYTINSLYINKKRGILHYKNGGYLAIILSGSFIVAWQMAPSICPSPAHKCVRAHSEIHFYTFLKIHVNARGRVPVCQTSDVSCRKCRREWRSHITFCNNAMTSTIICSHYSQNAAFNSLISSYGKHSALPPRCSINSTIFCAKAIPC